VSQRRDGGVDPNRHAKTPGDVVPGSRRDDAERNLGPRAGAGAEVHHPVTADDHEGTRPSLDGVLRSPAGLGDARAGQVGHVVAGVRQQARHSGAGADATPLSRGGIGDHRDGLRHV
jgi:hypothetical protein